jgi:hypothetical protein
MFDVFIFYLFSFLLTHSTHKKREIQEEEFIWNDFQKEKRKTRRGHLSTVELSTGAAGIYHYLSIHVIFISFSPLLIKPIPYKVGFLLKKYLFISFEGKKKII